MTIKAEHASHSHSNLISEPQQPHFASAEEQLRYKLLVDNYNDICGASADNILTRGNPFLFKNFVVARQFEKAVMVYMGGIPPPPPFSPITPASHSSQFDATYKMQPERVFQHEQPDATFVDTPRAAPETVDLATNPDAAAVKANIGILLFQEKKVLANLQKLDSLVTEAAEHPKEFYQAIRSGDVQIDDNTPDTIATWLPEYMKNSYKKQDAIWGPTEDELLDEWMKYDKMTADGAELSDHEKKRYAYLKGETGVDFMPLPSPVTVSKTPLINWAQYGVVGDSFDAVHRNALKTLGSDNAPAKLATDGSILTQNGLPDPRYMDREGYVADAERDTKRRADEKSAKDRDSRRKRH